MISLKKIQKSDYQPIQGTCAYEGVHCACACLCRAGEHLPAPGFSIMHVAKSVQIHFLRVPSEGALPHSEVNQRPLGRFDFVIALALQRVQYGVEMADVPVRHVLWGRGGCDQDDPHRFPKLSQHSQDQTASRWCPLRKEEGWRSGSSRTSSPAR